MPTIFREKGYRIGFFALDQGEPPHVHVMRGRQEVKYWLEPFVRMSRNKGFAAHELNEIERILIARRILLLEAWHAYFGP